MPIKGEDFKRQFLIRGTVFPQGIFREGKIMAGNATLKADGKLITAGPLKGKFYGGISRKTQQPFIIAPYDSITRDRCTGFTWDLAAQHASRSPSLRNAAESHLLGSACMPSQEELDQIYELITGKPQSELARSFNLSGSPDDSRYWSSTNYTPARATDGRQVVAVCQRFSDGRSGEVDGSLQLRLRLTQDLDSRYLNYCRSLDYYGDLGR